MPVGLFCGTYCLYWALIVDYHTCFTVRSNKIRGARAIITVFSIHARGVIQAGVAGALVSVWNKQGKMPISLG